MQLRGEVLDGKGGHKTWRKYACESGEFKGWARRGSFENDGEVEIVRLRGECRFAARGEIYI